ncbi:L10-interacting MYB domain-containing protein-like [Brachypodium distachyon]|uniref:L10-interacting MYB domain-containing protein-like n=1 Tax=Brachypodium distachyon TaxID=15368 RepID=UPI00071D6BD6|nr:L10-interacting MYB domain-containing protein-like [Brachypodium distachyon]|eukprot:XP_014755538.1 L10-interacting MYB domain-containing protein-like [Brachypodium distachyon]
MDGDKTSQKAVWDTDAARIFCEIACKEANEGNRPTKTLSVTGYNNLGEEFHRQTGRLYTRKQFKNCWDELKSIWTAWVYYMQKASGFGWDPVKRTITASEEQWAYLIKVHKDIKRFRKGPPDNLEWPEKMFQRASVTGNSSVMPGAEEDDTGERQDVDGKYYLVDSGYPNDTGYLAPYRGQKYHLPEFRIGRAPSGKQELFNFAHSSLRNVIERSFGVLKQKWRILGDVPSYPVKKQTKIIIACMALHNFIRESHLFDEDFDKCDRDEDYMPPGHVVVTNGWNHEGQGNVNMNATRETIANGLMADKE